MQNHVGYSPMRVRSPFRLLKNHNLQKSPAVIYPHVQVPSHIPEIFFSYPKETKNKFTTLTPPTIRISSTPLASPSPSSNPLDLMYPSANTTSSTPNTPNIINNTDDSIVNEFIQRQRFKENVELAWYGFLILTFGVFTVLTFRQSLGRGGGPGAFMGKEFDNKAETVNITFADVAGLDAAKEELLEIVDFLKNPEKYAAIGAKIPKGCLLTGGPGLGKTLLAKAVAGEASVPFFPSSAAEFMEMFVGVGASRVRDLFKKAKEKAPCIIFIDEIDAIGRSRGGKNSFGGGNDEREQTINQLLTEMDGFDCSRGIIVIAATNRPDILDSALVRPGRFDRQIALELPGKKAREDILRVHAKGKPFKADVNLEKIAQDTVGFSGAELENLLNEAAILAARRKLQDIGNAEVQDAFERLILGVERSDMVITKDKKRLTAFHEAGHALVALKIGEFNDIKKVSIMPRGNAGGVTMFNQEDTDSGIHSRQYLENQLAVALGGRVAEELVVGNQNVSTGASGDLERVQAIARAMIIRYGFSERLGPVGWHLTSAASASANPFEPTFSSKTLYEIDLEVRKLAKTAYGRARNIILNNQDLLRKIAELLMEKEIIDGEDIKRLDKTTKQLFNQDI